MPKINTMNILHKLFNWKRRPSSVFYIAMPLFVIGLGLHLAIAYMHFTLNGDWVYFAVFTCALALFVLALWPLRKQLWLLLTSEG